MARAHLACSATAARRLPRAVRLCLCALVVLLLAVQQWGQLHALHHGFSHGTGHADAQQGARDGASAHAHDLAPNHQGSSHPGAELCDLCLVLAAFTAVALPGLLHWCSARLGQPSPRGPPSVALPQRRGWTVRARGPPLELALTA